MTDIAALLARLRIMGDSARAAEMAAQNKAAREYLGVPAAEIDLFARTERRLHDLPTRCALARGLWESGVHEGCILGAKLLTQARIRPQDAEVWHIISDWAQGFDGAALADCAATAGAKRLEADPARLDAVETWLDSPNLWTRRAALVMTLPWARLPHPKAQDHAIRARVLSWAARLAPERNPYLNAAIAAWLRALSRRDAAQVRIFLEGPGAMLPLAFRQEMLGPDVVAEDSGKDEEAI
ncbi:MAG: DNA alkylation repair protein [Roseinatronobacter sp.]|jgi:3-methyladenine DNA glycosylase AlkD|nr:DNA alkylation repair protein [Roseinatronobacter sp.]